MAPAANLPEAADDAFDNLNTLWLAGTLKSKLGAFCTSLLDTFPQQDQNANPVSNWLVVIFALQSGLPATNVSYLSLIDAVDKIYKICWMTNQLGVVQSLIKTAQATAVLTAYNAQFT